MGALSSPINSPSDYSFPKSRLKTTQEDPTKTPVVLVACGSYSPITTLHLQMFETASEFINLNTNFEIMGGYLSPVSDASLPSLIKSSSTEQGVRHIRNKVLRMQHIGRLRMCELAVTERPHSGLMVDPWEALQPNYTLTAEVLDHFNHEINEVLGGPEQPDGARASRKIMLLAGADLIQTMSTPGLWSDEDLENILGKYGAMVVSRKGTDIDEALRGLERWRNNIYNFEPRSINDTSSTKVRAFVKKRQSIENLTPDSVIDYIEAHGLYQNDQANLKG